jgi:hypothetical protein
MRQQCVLLVKDGHQPKSRHMRTVTVNTDIPDVAHPCHTRHRLAPGTEVLGFHPKEI